MNNSILTIIKKEFARFFGDKRMVFTTIIMPGLLIYLIYSFMGDGLKDTFAPDEDYRAKVYVQNMPETVQPIFDSLDMDITNADNMNVDSLKTLIETKKIELLVVFPQQFDSSISSYNVLDTTQVAPNVLMYSNFTNVESENAESKVRYMLEEYEKSISNKFDINGYREENANETFDLATDEDAMGEIFSMMTPSGICSIFCRLTR